MKNLFKKLMSKIGYVPVETKSTIVNINIEHLVTFDVDVQGEELKEAVYNTILKALSDSEAIKS